MQPADLEPDAVPLLVDRVEWVPASLDTIEVRVHGRWSDEPPAAPAVLLVDDGGRRQAFPAVSAGPGAVAPWTAAFVVPGEMRPRLRAGLRLGVGEAELSLPGAAPGAVETPPEGEVIDRAVLAERRARRAEQVEETLAERAAGAEQVAATLEAQLSNLEQRLAGLTGERERLIADLATRERELREVRQREHAEQQRRLQAEEDRDALRGSLEAELRELRAELAATHERAAALRSEGEALREALHGAEAVAASPPAPQPATRPTIHDPRLTAMQTQVDALRAELGRWRAEGVVEAPPPAAAPDEHALAALVGDLRGTIVSLRAAFERELAAISEEVAELRRQLDAERAARQSAEEGLGSATERAAAPVGPISAAAQEVIDDLAAAARRLREQAGEGQPDEIASTASPPHSTAGADHAPRSDAFSRTPVSAPRRWPFSRAAPESWLSRAIGELAESDPATGARLFAALLPAQAQTADQDLVYDVSVTEFGAFRVTIAPGSARLRREPALLPDAADLELEGPASALAPLAGGGAPRRLRDVRVEGSRRALRRLLRSAREPVTLARLARGGVWVEPGLLLAALARRVDPAWTAGRRFTVVYVVEGARGGAWTVAAADGAPLAVHAEPPRTPPAATVRLAEPVFLWHLAGLAAPAGAGVAVDGDAGAAATLGAWFARVQQTSPSA